MTAYDIYERAMLIAGYTDFEGRIDNTPSRAVRALAAVNRIVEDLNIPVAANSLFDEISANSSKLDAMVYGVGMLMSLGDGDSEKNRLFAELYNAKRAGVRKCRGYITDNLPETEGGII